MRIVLLFNLKPNADLHAFETWVRKNGLPTLRALVSVADARIDQAVEPFGGGAQAPYRYIATINVVGRDDFEQDASGESMRRFRTELEQFADNPLWILTEPVPEVG